MIINQNSVITDYAPLLILGEQDNYQKREIESNNY